MFRDKLYLQKLQNQFSSQIHANSTSHPHFLYFWLTTHIPYCYFIGLITQMPQE